MEEVLQEEDLVEAVEVPGKKVSPGTNKGAGRQSKRLLEHPDADDVRRNEALGQHGAVFELEVTGDRGELRNVGIRNLVEGTSLFDDDLGECEERAELVLPVPLGGTRQTDLPDLARMDAQQRLPHILFEPCAHVVLDTPAEAAFGETAERGDLGTAHERGPVELDVEGGEAGRLVDLSDRFHALLEAEVHEHEALVDDGKHLDELGRKRRRIGLPEIESGSNELGAARTPVEWDVAPTFGTQPKSEARIGTGAHINDRESGEFREQERRCIIGELERGAKDVVLLGNGAFVHAPMRQIRHRVLLTHTA